MKKITTILIAIIAFFSLNFKSSAQTVQPAESNALLYKISGKGLQKPSYIYGTIHIICQNDMFGMDKINSYIDQSEQILMELDMDNVTEMQTMATGAMMTDGKTLKDLLNDEQYSKVDEMFKNIIGISVDTVKTYRPMFLSVMISTSPKSMGCQTPGSYELSLLQTAATKKKPIEGLETVAAQFEKISKKSNAEQAKELYETALNPQKAIDEFKEMIGVYKSQNSENLYKVIDGRLGNPEFQKVMLDERNIDWIPKIEKAISKKSTFIAVGGGHLGGENGVINLLRKQGYTVEAIKL